MLTGKLVRVKHARNKLVPMYIHAADPNWHGVAEQLLFIYRDSPGHTRGEIEEELANAIDEGAGQLIHQGLAKLLEDRCEYEVVADLPPEQIRESVFRIATIHRQLAAKTSVPFDRVAVLKQVGEELNQAPEDIDRALFADLKGEQRVLKFEDITAGQLLDRYNVALAQSVLLRCVKMEVRVWGESPARFRQLFRAVKFRKLIAAIRETPGNSYTISLDGPLSLFSSTQKYGLQLAMFLPSLLHCKAFQLTADVRWGVEKKEKSFELSANDGLRTHYQDFGVYTPKEFTLFLESFRATVSDWTIDDNPSLIALEGGVWVPDFTLTHTPTGKEVYVEMFGFWRKLDLESHYKRLKSQRPGQFLLVVSEAMRADEDVEATFGDEVYRYKRTPSAEAIVKLAAKISSVTKRGV